jgi:hypothetical protein
MFTPELWRNQQSIDAFVEPEDSLSFSARLKTAGNVQPNRFFKGSLNKGAAEIDRASVPVQNERQHQEETHCAPRHNWGEGLEHSLFQIACCHGSGFVRFYVSIRGALVPKDPLRGQDSVSRFNTKGTVLACLEESPMFIVQ